MGDLFLVSDGLIWFDLVFLLGWNGWFEYTSPRESCSFYFLGQLLICFDTIFLSGQNQVACTVLSVWLSLPCHIYFYISLKSVIIFHAFLCLYLVTGGYYWSLIALLSKSHVQQWMNILLAFNPDMWRELVWCLAVEWPSDHTWLWGWWWFLSFIMRVLKSSSFIFFLLFFHWQKRKKFIKMLWASFYFDNLERKWLDVKKRWLFFFVFFLWIQLKTLLLLLSSSAIYKDTVRLELVTTS